MKKEELTSRREFFKKAAKASLPVIGAIILSNVPTIKSIASTGCDGNCKGGCDGSCKYFCDGGCKSGCEGSCSGGCETTCRYGCESTCKGHCDGSSYHRS